jgi:hypothetical protein
MINLVTICHDYIGELMDKDKLEKIERTVNEYGDKLEQHEFKIAHTLKSAERDVSIVRTFTTLFLTIIGILAGLGIFLSFDSAQDVAGVPATAGAVVNATLSNVVGSYLVDAAGTQQSLLNQQDVTSEARLNIAATAQIVQLNEQATQAAEQLNALIAAQNSQLNAQSTQIALQGTQIADQVEGAVDAIEHVGNIVSTVEQVSVQTLVAQQVATEIQRTATPQMALTSTAQAQQEGNIQATSTVRFAATQQVLSEFATETAIFEVVATETAVFVEENHCRITVLTSALNIRDYPDMAISSIIGGLYQGDSMEVVGRSSNLFWWNICYAGQSAWISGVDENENLFSQP